MPRLFRLVFSWLALTLLLGCSLSDQLPRPSIPSVTPLPLSEITPSLEVLPSGPTVIVLPRGPSATLAADASATAALTLSPTRTLRPTRVVISPTITGTPTLDPFNVGLRIAVPGPMSKVTSPIDFVVYIAPDYTGGTRIELIGEDGRSLYAKAFRTFPNIGYTTRVAESVSFEIHGVAEVARLQVSTMDQYGRLQAVSSVRLLLLSVGENQFSPAYAPVERVLLRNPKRGDEVSGGVLNIQGEIQPMNDLPVVLELYDSDGKSLGSRILSLQHADGTYQLFSASIPYQIDKKTPARLLIHQDDDRIAGLAYLYSIEMLLAP